MNGNEDWDNSIIENAIERLNLTEWLKQEIIDSVEVEQDEDDEGHKSYIWEDKGYYHGSRVDEIAEKLLSQYMLEEKFGDDPHTQNIITCALDLMARKILKRIYDEAYEQALDELPNPNERND